LASVIAGVMLYLEEQKFPAAEKFIEEYGMLDIYLPKIRPGVSEEYIKKYKRQ